MRTIEISELGRIGLGKLSATAALLAALAGAGCGEVGDGAAAAGDVEQVTGAVTSQEQIDCASTTGNWLSWRPSWKVPSRRHSCCAGDAHSYRSATKNPLAFIWAGGSWGSCHEAARGTRGHGMLYLAYQTQSDVMAPV